MNKQPPAVATIKEIIPGQPHYGLFVYGVYIPGAHVPGELAERINTAAKRQQEEVTTAIYAGSGCCQ